MKFTIIKIFVIFIIFFLYYNKSNIELFSIGSQRTGNVQIQIIDSTIHQTRVRRR
jgi:hypothetical protein